MKTCPRCEKEFDDSGLEFCPEDGARLVNIPSGEAPPDPLVGQMLTERIRIESKIGEGGMGAVYKGEDVLLGRTVAVKVMHAALKHSPDDVRRFLHEARIVARLRHPNTIQVFDFGEAKTGHYYIAMEYMTGEPLDLYFERNRPTIGRIFEIVEQVCLSLEEAHAAGIVHRDLKPDNIFIDTVNNRRLVKVIDFGIAKLVEGGENLTQAGMVFGTPAYMSPEQARGEKLDSRSDVYALGCVMFAMLTGRPPFVGDSAMDVAIKHLTQPPPDLQPLSRFGTLPPRLIELVDQMLSKDRTKRPQTVSEVRQKVLEVARSTPEVRFDAPGNSGAMLKIRTEPTVTQPAPGATQIAGRTSTGKATIPPEPETTVFEAPKSGRGAKVAAIAVAATLAVGGAAFVLTRPGAPATEQADTTDIVPAEADAGTTEVVAVPDDAMPALDPDAAVATARGTVRSAVASSVLRAQQATANVSVSSTPTGATVTRADTGAVLGTTPLNWATRSMTESVTLNFTLEGYAPASVAVAPAAGQSATAELERAAGPRRERPATEEPPGEEPETPPETNGGGLELRRPVTIPTE